MASTSAIKVDGKKIKLTHPDKVLFPKSDITKAELVNYYRQVAISALPHLKGIAP